jgi:hypothetical protein
MTAEEIVIDGLVARSRRLTRTAGPRLLLGLLGVLLVVIGAGELAIVNVMWLYVVHLLSGLVALAATPWRRLVRPAFVLLGVLYVVLYVLEIVAPQDTGDTLSVTGNSSLIMSGVVIVIVMVGLMWPWVPFGREKKTQQDDRRGS